MNRKRHAFWEGKLSELNRLKLEVEFEIRREKQLQRKEREVDERIVVNTFKHSRARKIPENPPSTATRSHFSLHFPAAPQSTAAPGSEVLGGTGSVLVSIALLKSNPAYSSPSILFPKSPT